MKSPPKAVRNGYDPYYSPFDVEGYQNNENLWDFLEDLSTKERQRLINTKK